MQKRLSIPPPVFLLLMLCSPSRAADWFDGFESYASDSTIAGQGLWETWDQEPASDARVSDLRAAGGGKSLRVVSENGLDADIVRLFQGIRTGSWRVSAKAYIPRTQQGDLFFIVLNRYVHGGPYIWSVELRMNAREGVVVDEVGGGTLSLLLDQWAEIAVEINLDENTHSVFYGGLPLLLDAVYVQGTGQDAALEAIDLYSSGSTDSYYDDVSLQRICIPAEVKRTFTADHAMVVEDVLQAAYREGGLLSVTLTVSDIRTNLSGCPDLEAVVITETLPPGWTVSEITGAGDVSDGAISWRFEPGALHEGELSYAVSGPVEFGNVPVEGVVREDGNPIAFPVEGDVIPTGEHIKHTGGILDWLVLGPFEHLAGSPPNLSVMRQDYLTDGRRFFETSLHPVAGEQVPTDFEKAASTALGAVQNRKLNPYGVPAWYHWRASDEKMELSHPLLFADNDYCMCYAVTYLCPAETQRVRFCCGSSGGVQLLLDGMELWSRPEDRLWRGFQDYTSAVTLTKGVHQLMVKSFNSTGPWHFGVRMLAEGGDGPPAGVASILQPELCSGSTALFKRGDADADGAVTLADAIFLLSCLFVRDVVPDCPDAADANDDGRLDITDPVMVLIHLFTDAGLMPPPEGECGEDPHGDFLPACSYPEDRC